MNDITDGLQNVAVGHESLTKMTSGTECVAVGFQALEVATGGGTTAIGWKAGEAVSTGTHNIMIGNGAGDSTVTSGGNNIVIGKGSELGGAGQENQIVIAAMGSGKGSHTGYINPNGGGIYQGSNSASWATTSDRRIKKNITDNTDGLDIINQIRVRNFEYRTQDEIVDFDNPKAAVVEQEGIQLGAIAQEIEDILPEIVKTEEIGVKTINPNNLTWHLINAVKELSAKNEALEARIATLEG
jgi:hypothetical protein